MSKRHGLHDLELYLHHETSPDKEDEGAILVSTDGNRGDAVWLPKSVAQFERKSGRTVVVTAPEQILIDKGLV